MSTKTTFKRVALVAVASLGFGVLTSVAPASADEATITSVSVGTPAAARIGQAGVIPVTFKFAAGSNGDTFTVGAKVVTAPTTSKAAGAATGSSAAAGFLTVTEVSLDGTTNGISAGTSGEVANGSGAFDATTSSLVTLGSSTTATSATVNFNFKADIAGTYTFLFWAGGSSWSASYKQTTGSVTVVGAPSAITITKIGSTVPDQDTTYGALLAVTLKDAAGNATRLGTGESLSVTASSSVTLQLLGSASTITALGAGNDYLGKGVYYVRAVSADTTQDSSSATITVAGSGGLIPATVTTNTTVSVVDVDLTTDVTGVALTDATGYDCTDNDCTTAAASAHGFTATRSSGSASADTDGLSYGTTIRATSGLIYAGVVAFAAEKTTAKFSITAALGAADTAAFYVNMLGSSNDDEQVDLTYSAAAFTALDVVGASSVISATAGSSVWTVQATDQYDNALQYVPVTVAVSGRNTVATKALGVTNADGYISYTLKDAGTTGTTDSITFSGTLDSTTDTAAATVTYGTVTVDTVTVSGGSKAETVAGSTLTEISTADNGPEASAKAISAVVKDASGNLLAGVPVTFSVDKGAIKKTAGQDYATVYTNSAGKATTYVFNWIAEMQTVTATAGTKTGTDYLTWAATDATSARVLSGTASGNIVSLKVVDRFGNGVKGVTIDLSRTGSGFFGTGKSSDTVVTDKNGTADIQFNGTGSVVAELGSTYAQAADAAGEIEETAVTAAVAGTTKGTGASLAPKGVNKVSLDTTAGSDATTVAATAAADAAAEATDAANAATDAANAAAEAADAATAAAQDAADAVAALSAQVATLISGLKSQLTALTNLVIKIQKKVKA